MQFDAVLEGVFFEEAVALVGQLRGHGGLGGPLLLGHHDGKRVGNAQDLDDPLAFHLRNGRLRERHEHSTQAVETLHVSGVGRQIWETTPNKWSLTYWWISLISSRLRIRTNR